MRYGQIRQFDIANGEGIRTTVFVTGCTHHCKDCFNEEYQDFNHGNLWTNEQTEQIISFLENPMVAGLTLLGGEPFQNAVDLLPVIKEVKKHSSKTIWIYSGYTFEEICTDATKKELLKLCDILVDGRFVTEQKDLTLRFRGSANQRILDIKASLKNNAPVLYTLH